MEPISVLIKNRRQNSDGSLKNRIPMMAVPTAPIPVHTAYAVPIGIVCMALFRRKKLKEIQIKKPILQPMCLKLLENLRQVVNPTSKMPARISISQFMSAKLSFYKVIVPSCSPVTVIGNGLHGL